jgi:hypothetical protein
MISRLARRVQRGIIRSHFQAAQQRSVLGLPVGVSSRITDADTAFNRVGAALTLLGMHQPWTLRHLRRQARGILVWQRPLSYGIASWHYGVKLLILEANFLCDPKTTTARIAATLVHEATHARLDRFGYAAENRARIEAICFRRERAFVRHVADTSELLDEIDRQLRRDSSYWAEDVRVKQIVDELTRLGLPAWLIRIIQRRFRGRVAGAMPTIRPSRRR